MLAGVNPSQRRDHDWYRTPAYQTRALLRRITLPRKAVVLEPCCGDGAILELLPDSCDVIANDIVRRDPIVPDFLLDATLRASWDRFALLSGPIDITATNPTFALAFPIVQLAIEYSRLAVIMLLRLSWLEPTKGTRGDPTDHGRSRWLAQHPPSGLIVLPRHDYRGDGRSDSVTSAWMIWNAPTVAIYRGIDVVSVDERDALLADEQRGMRGAPEHTV